MEVNQPRASKLALIERAHSRDMGKAAKDDN